MDNLLAIINICPLSLLKSSTKYNNHLKTFTIMYRVVSLINRSVLFKSRSIDAVFRYCYTYRTEQDYTLCIQDDNGNDLVKF
jgi:hypothetical protein